MQERTHPTLKVNAPTQAEILKFIESGTKKVIQAGIFEYTIYVMDGQVLVDKIEQIAENDYSKYDEYR